ncbi:MAG TPA: hypothetical protein DEP99_06375 [Nitrospiraceae bacterium]|nr:hypothetical protein [Nitrospiraceae bacterium]
MRKSLSEKSEKVIEKGIGELKQSSSLAELTRAGARACPELDSGMMLEVAIEEEVTAFLERDYYERQEGI